MAACLGICFLHHHKSKKVKTFFQLIVFELKLLLIELSVCRLYLEMDEGGDHSITDYSFQYTNLQEASMDQKDSATWSDDCKTTFSTLKTSTEGFWFRWTPLHSALGQS